ncbi:MTH865 family protein [Haloarcula sp. CBA1127]|uniref:MTH865 family protein n=1 Tax=Haloarcula sp. CBA1127 TaxID=1765055 RepID=UPI00073F8E32|nr:MTH865 family protein [Haloarcula sp. CBA1127]
MTEDTAEQLRAELEAVFTSAEYPVEEPMELVPVLPDGPSTTFEAGDVRVGVMDFGTEYAEYQDYPYETAAALVDDLMAGFREEGLFD